MIDVQDLYCRAETLAKTENEVEWREGIKTAYYYVFHQVNAFIKERQITQVEQKNNIGVHQLLIERLKSIKHPLAKSLARDMQIMKDKRTLSCYILAENITKQNINQQVNQAKLFIQKLNKLNEVFIQENE